MHAGSDSFEGVMRGLSAGDQQAARAIYERFINRLIRLAAVKLDRRLGPQADPEDVAHSVFESFFDGHGKGQYELHNWGMVFGLLSHIAFRKCLNRNRDLRREKRDGGTPAPLEDWQAAAAGPGPDDEAVIAEHLARSLAGFDPDERAILDAYMNGSTVEAVAARVGFSTRTVQRVLERFRKLLLALADES